MKTRVVITFDSGNRVTGIFESFERAEDFCVALVDCCEDVSSLDFYEVQNDES